MINSGGEGGASLYHIDLKVEMVAMSFLFCNVLDHLISNTAPAEVQIRSALANYLV